MASESAESSRDPTGLRSSGRRTWRGTLRVYALALWRDRGFHAFVAGYALLGYLLALALGVPYKFSVQLYVRPLAALVPMGMLVTVVGLGILALRRPRPLGAFVDLLYRAFNPRIAAGLLLFASLTVFIGIFSSVKTMLADIHPFFADRFLANLDRSLHFGHDPWQFTAHWALLTNAVEFVYFAGWGVALTGSMIAVLLLPSLRVIRARFVWTFLLAWALLGNLVAGLGYSAGPIFYGLVTGDARYDGLIQYLAHNATSLRFAHGFLWSAYTHAEVAVGAGISAFPSMHVAIATLCVLVASAVNAWWRWTAIGFAALIVYGSVHLGWHYGIDGYFSIAAVLSLWSLVGRLQGRRAGAPTANVSRSAACG